MPDYPEWMEALPEEMRENPALNDTPDVETLAKRFIDNHAIVGRSVRLPGEDATDDDRAAFNKDLMEKVPGLMLTPDLNDEEAMAALFERLGRPEDADKYEVPEFETHGMKTDDSIIKRLGPIAHKYGLSQKQFAGIVKEVSEGNIQQALVVKTEHEKNMADLKGKWGENYDSRMKGLALMLKQTGAPEGLVEGVKEGMVDTATLEWLHSVKKLFGKEGNELIVQDTDEEPGLDAVEAQQRADEIFKQLQDMEPSDPRYRPLMNKRVELIKIATAA